MRSQCWTWLPDSLLIITSLRLRQNGCWCLIRPRAELLQLILWFKKKRRKKKKEKKERKKPPTSSTIVFWCGLYKNNSNVRHNTRKFLPLTLKRCEQKTRSYLTLPVCAERKCALCRWKCTRTLARTHTHTRSQCESRYNWTPPLLWPRLFHQSASPPSHGLQEAAAANAALIAAGLEERHVPTY